MSIKLSGAPDSKYFHKPNQFDIDINEKVEATEKFKETIRNMILEKPDKIEQRYTNVVEVMIEIKKEFNL